MAKNLTIKDFDKEVLKAKEPVMVDFWAEWCGPCRIMAPVVDELSKDVEGKAKVIKVDIEAEGELAQKYGVMSIPTFLFFKNGKVVEQAVGVVDKKKLQQKLEKLS